MSFVSFSTKYDPPSGSTTFATPLSNAMICWVRSASVAASAVGRASASSSELVWSDCVPPSTPDSACSDAPLHVLDAVAQRERQLLGGRRTRLADVVPAHRDRVPLRHLRGAEREHVGD